MNASFDFDCFVVGAGSAGVRFARVASQQGARVAVAEHRYLGGTCVNVGCVPKKLFVYASQFSKSYKLASSFGWQVATPEFDWPTFIAAKDVEIKRLNGIYGGLLSKANVTLLEGQARIAGPNTVVVNQRSYTCRTIIIAVGGWPRRGDYPGAEHTMTSNEIFGLTKQPKRVLVEGGGYIAVEFAGILNGLGSATTLCYRGPLFLRGFDQPIRQALAEAYTQNGVQLKWNTTIQAIEKLPSGELKVTDNHGEHQTFDAVLSAIGRHPLTEDLGLETVGVECSPSGHIVVNDHFQTSEPSIYALGDVVGRIDLTPVAIHEATALAHHLVSGHSISIDYSSIPTAIFSQPEIATVGLTEAQAQASGKTVSVFESRFNPMKYSLGAFKQKSLLRLIVESDTQVVLGAHMLGDDAAEMMQTLAIAVKMGATKQDFDRTIGIHPTSAEEWVTLK